MKSILMSNWNFVRVFRLLAGAAALSYAVYSNDLLLGIAGGLFFVMAVFNTGCCMSAGSCKMPPKKQATHNN